MAITSGKKIEGDETIHHQSPSKKREKKKKKGQPPMQPQLTPMIDVTFQLLLFFILTCEFRESEGQIPGTLPAKGNVAQAVSDTPPPDPIQIKVMASARLDQATYEVTGHSFALKTPQELQDLLKIRKAAVGDEVPIIILPNQGVPWGYVVEAFNQAKEVKFKKIGFAQELGA